MRAARALLCFGQLFVGVHLFVLVSHIKSGWLSSWNGCEIPAPLLQVEMVCWQPVISGQGSDLQHRRAPEEGQSKDSFPWPLEVLGQDLG